MAEKEHLARLKQGVEAWDRWREENPDLKPDLSDAKLERAGCVAKNSSHAISGVNRSQSLKFFYYA